VVRTEGDRRAADGRDVGPEDEERAPGTPAQEPGDEGRVVVLGFPPLLAGLGAVAAITSAITNRATASVLRERSLRRHTSIEPRADVDEVEALDE
jgi:hypothetical protein